ncbi:MAG: FAD-dependent oxidoreductase [Rhodospirillaceae bacterium]
MAHREGAAIVLGGSMSGLLAARSLSDHFERVTIVERDVPADGSHLRKGVPQAAHAHGLLASGYRLIDEYFPGIMDELESLGAPRGDVTGSFLWFQYGRWKLRYDSGLRGITVSRSCLEAAVRRRLCAIPNIVFLDGTAGVKPLFDAASSRVTGLLVRRRDGLESALDAKLVVDASGRGSQSPKWLAEWGFGAPEVATVKVDVGYATRVFERRPGDFFDTNGGVISATPPASTRYAAVLAVEDQRWMVTLAGSLADYPPTEEREWLRFAAALPVSAVYDLAASARPLSEIASYRFAANQRRFYERMKRFPDGYLVIGDAVCSFNPIYGQGMSVAAAAAKALDDSEPSRLEGLPGRFYARVSKIVDIPWAIATGEDLRFPQVEGKRPAGFRLFNWYLERVHAAASVDAEVCRHFFEVLNLLAPPAALMKPALAWRVLARRSVGPPAQDALPGMTHGI